MVITTADFAIFSIVGCGRPHFEWLLQRWSCSLFPLKVVEGHILSGYYNDSRKNRVFRLVVEGHILSGYYNVMCGVHFMAELWKATF